MKALDVLKSKAIRCGGELALKCKEKSPEIFMVSGILLIIGGTFLACRATLKADEVLNEYEKSQDDIQEAEEKFGGTSTYTPEDIKRDKTLAMTKLVIGMVRHYAPAVVCLTTGIGLICAAHGIMRKRNAAIMAAYNAVDLAFKEYRKRVIAEEGELKDRHYLTGAEYEEVINVSTGETQIQEKIECPDKKKEYSMYCKFFDEASSFWRKDATQNLMFLRIVQNNMNDLLNSRGYVFLNEVYRAMDIPDTSYGQVVGWRKVKGEDVYIDLGLYDITDASKRRFVNGDERCVLVNPNVQGVIYNTI